MSNAIDALVEAAVPSNPSNQPDNNTSPLNEQSMHHPVSSTPVAQSSPAPAAIVRESNRRRDDTDVDEFQVNRPKRGGDDIDDRDYKKKRSTSRNLSPKQQRERLNRSPSPITWKRERRSGGSRSRRHRDAGYKKRSASRRPSPALRDRERLVQSPSPIVWKRERRGRGSRRLGYDGGRQPDAGERYPYSDERPYVSLMYSDRLGHQNNLEDSGCHLCRKRPDKRKGLMSFKQFIQQLEDDIQPPEAECRYNEYKSKYISAQKKFFFELHKAYNWLKDKYHPTNLLAVIERRNYHAQKLAHDFLLALQNDSLILGPGVNTFLNKHGQSEKSNYNDKPNDGGKRKDNDRGSAKKSAPKAHPISSEPRRILIDIEQAQALIGKLDSEKDIVENILGGPWKGDSKGSTDPVMVVRGLDFVKHLKSTELLETLITYLWSIHGLDYYGMVETSEPKGLRYVRSEASNANISNGAEWENNLDSHWKKRLDGQDPLELMICKEKIDAAADQALDPYINKIKDAKHGWKFGCRGMGCAKFFISSEYVLKHLKLSHPELVIELTSNIREDLYFENYMNDPNAPWKQCYTPVLCRRQ